jgi:hypothetical protein
MPHLKRVAELNPVLDHYVESWRGESYSQISTRQRSAYFLSPWVFYRALRMRTFGEFPKKRTHRPTVHSKFAAASKTAIIGSRRRNSRIRLRLCNSVSETKNMDTSHNKAEKLSPDAEVGNLAKELTKPSPQDHARCPWALLEIST